MAQSHSADHDGTLYQLKKYQRLLESVHGYTIFLLDTSGRIETWNTGGETVFGYSSNEIVNEHFSSLYDQQSFATDDSHPTLQHAAEKGHTEVERWCVKKNGRRFWALDSTTALFDDNNILSGFAKIIQDISVQKRHQDALASANKLFKHQRIELEALGKMKDEFISLATHQLRTPATGVKQFLGLLLEGFAGPLSDQQTNFIQKAYASNERQLTLVSSLLQTAQIDAGKIHLSKTIVDIRLLIEDIVDELKDVIEERQQTVKIVEDPDFEHVCVDVLQMRMVLENLIDNASKYTFPGGKITITLSTTKVHDCIAIKDTGVGIAEKDIGRLFEKFSKVSNPLSESVGGTGLGLYWAKKIITLHRGTIRVKSQPNVGTEFIINIPKAESRG